MVDFFVTMERGIRKTGGVTKRGAIFEWVIGGTFFIAQLVLTFLLFTYSLKIINFFSLNKNWRYRSLEQKINRIYKHKTFIHKIYNMMTSTL